ncbi:aldehyde dehydrogenase family protein [Peribacillus frigoritolerans]
MLHGSKQQVGLDEGFNIEPTVFEDVLPIMTIALEEIFGPVLVFVKVKTIKFSVLGAVTGCS